MSPQQWRVLIGPTGARRHAVLRKAEIEKKALELLELYAPTATGEAVDPVRLAAAQNIRIYNAVFDDNKTEGMISQRGDRTQIYVNSRSHPVRKRFTIAHELGHYFLHMSGGDSDFIDLSDNFRTAYEPDQQWTPHRRREWEANTFAGALLMPEPFITHLMKIDPSLLFISNRLQVSKQTASIRLDGLGISTNDN